jgi:CDP-glucose 4,6-dehydratase
MNQNFWRGKKVFLTGHTGFKGSWMSLWLQEMGAHVTGFALRPPTNPSLFELADVAQGMHSIEGDVRDLRALTEAMAAAQPDVVFHMAAQPLVRLSYKIPVETYATNVMGTVNCLEAVRQTTSVKAVVVITTDKCYENKEWVWGYREDEPMGGHDPYSNSKGCAELVVSAYRRSFFSSPNAPQVASARAGNVIGGGDFAEDRLIPDIVRAALANTILDIRNPDATRPWQHVLEPLSGYLMLAERLCSPGAAAFAEGWNFGPVDTDAWPVKRVVETMFSTWKDVNVPVRFGTPADLHEAKWLKLDISKARHKLGWEPALPIHKGLALTASWYQAFTQKQQMRELTLQQVHAYSSARFEAKP